MRFARVVGVIAVAGARPGLYPVAAFSTPPYTAVSATWLSSTSVGLSGCNLCRLNISMRSYVAAWKLHRIGQDSGE